VFRPTTIGGGEEELTATTRHDPAIVARRTWVDARKSKMCVVVRRTLARRDNTTRFGRFLIGVSITPLTKKCSYAAITSPLRARAVGRNRSEARLEHKDSATNAVRIGRVDPGGGGNNSNYCTETAPLSVAKRQWWLEVDFVGVLFEKPPETGTRYCCSVRRHGETTVVRRIALIKQRARPLQTTDVEYVPYFLES